MKLNSRLLVLAISSLIICGCTKTSLEEQSVIDPPAPDTSASFNLVITDTPCFKPTSVPEFLIVGEPLSDEQNITLEVHVTKQGKWQYSTDTLNGYYFHGIGEFTDTGNNHIDLIAHGTPIKPGNDRFTFKGQSSATQYEISALDTNIQIEAVPLNISFTGKIGDDEFSVTYPLAGPNNIPYGYAQGDSAGFAAYVTPGTYPNPPGTGSLSVQKQFLFNYYASTEEDFKNFFKPGAYPITKPTCFRSGLIMFWVDDNDASWSTFWGTGDQSGSSFKIVGVEDGHDNTGTYFVKVYAKFNCKLYELSSGEMKELTNGEMVGYFYRRS
jgi:hypothetical protein